MKPIIVCYSYSGNNKKLALKLKEELGCEILNISEKRKRNTIGILLDFIFDRDTKLVNYKLSKNNYDMFIFVAPVWGGRIATPMREFIGREKNNIKKYSIVTICNGTIGQKEKIIEDLLAITNREPVVVKELWINSLLPPEKQNKIKHTFKYKVSESDINRYDSEINELICNVTMS